MISTKNCPTKYFQTYIKNPNKIKTELPHENCLDMELAAEIYTGKTENLYRKIINQNWPWSLHTPFFEFAYLFTRNKTEYARTRAHQL